MEYLLTYILPILIVMIFSVVITFLFIKQENKRKQFEIRAQEGRDLMQQRILAYERLILLLERLQPESLIIREQNNTMNSMEFHKHLLKVVRREFEHNLTMQLYVKSKTWEKIKSTRETLLRTINSCATNVKPEDPAIVLGHAIIERSGGELIHYFRNSIKSIKEEMNSFYGGDLLS